MTLKLVALDDELYRSWQIHCANLDCVEVFLGSILGVDCDAVVSPTNSFGFMDGGIDLNYIAHFGKAVQSRLQRAIQDNYRGQLLVGQAELIHTENMGIPYLIAAPTMRVPESLYSSVNPYLAMRAVLILLKYGCYKGYLVSDLISTIAVPGLGTGVGEIHPEVCARQMRYAIEEVIYERHTFPESWSHAQEIHAGLIESPRRTGNDETLD
ncbi:MAG: macro domain-containing protein [Halioglobus sp.]|nr:macro domain-containing protein [Halioglobus sp.]